MDTLLEALRRASATDRNAHRPVFFRLCDPSDRAALEDLLKLEPRVLVFDELHNQLTELVRTLNPSIIYTKAERDAAAKAHIKDIPSEEYGVWVYYPWSFRLVHVLDEAEFVLVRTDRNRNKITREEQNLLATKRIGVIGLSVGQSVSLTMAQERVFGELRLADFDTLELSNLNRIRSGVHEMGTSKVINTAREIAEIDPYLKITCFPEGITESNMDLFFTEGGNLDILVEECDSVAIKILARQKARELRIPVVMDTSDRGMVDIERFDLEPERPILHGLVDHLDLGLAAKAKTNEEKLPFVVPILGLETLSKRMKASMLEIENSVTTWPQLASSVVMGGAVGGHAVRRIALGHDLPSGRWWLDPDDVFGVAERDIVGTKDVPAQSPLKTAATCITLEQMMAAAGRIPLRSGTEVLSSVEARDIVQACMHAPSGGNCQPWKFLHHEGRLFVYLDAERAHSALDPGLRYAYLGMGACVENALLEAGRQGFTLRQSLMPLPDVPELVAVLEIETRFDPAAFDQQEAVLAGQIALRCTNRKDSEDMLITPNEAGALIDVVRTKLPHTPIKIIHDRGMIERIAQLCGRAERIRFLNATCHHDMFVKEMRWNKEDTERTKDGIDLATLELSLTDSTGLRIAADPRAIALLRDWGTGSALEKLAAKSIRASSALAIVSVPDLGLASTYAGGRAMQRFWLKASAMGILAHPVGAPIFMGIHKLWDKDAILSAEEHQEAGEILEDLVGIIGADGSQPFFMMRLGRAGEPTARSLRLPIADVLHSTVRVLA